MDSKTNENKQQEAAETLAIKEDMSVEEEIDYISGFLKAAEMIEETTKTILIKRNGVSLFSFKIHALTEEEMIKARKMATTYMPNPKSKKLPPIEKEIDSALGKSCLIYLATVDEDKKKLWDNKTLKDKLNFIGTGYEMIDKVLLPGEKSNIIDVIDTLSGFDEDEIDTTEAAKN